MRERPRAMLNRSRLLMWLSSLTSLTGGKVAESGVAVESKLFSTEMTMFRCMESH